MSVSLTTANAMIFLSFVLIMVALAGIYRSLDNPPPASFSKRREEALEASVVFQFFHPVILYLAEFNDAYPESTRDALELKLRRAGRPLDYRPEEYLAVCQITAVCMALVSGFYGVLIFGIGGAFAGVIAGVVGYVAPLFVLNEWVNTRVTALVLKLPYAIDLLALCLQSGSTFVGGVEELVKEGGDDPLDQEFRSFLTELSLGKTRREALENLADRCGIELLNGLVMALIQGEEQGITIAEILKRQSAHIRSIRLMLADEKAAKASTKILFPTMMIVIALLLVLFGSFIVKLLRGKVLEE